MLGYLGLFVILGSLPVFALAGWTILSFWRLSLEAKKEKGFALRKASLSVAEWQRWNEEFFRWQVLRIPIFLSCAEGVLLALAIKKLSHFTELLLLIFVFQLIPVASLYFFQLWLLFRFGRFNLERFDKERQFARRQAIFYFYVCAWVPLIATWGFLRVILV